MQTNKALGKLLCNVGEERFNRIKKEKMEEHMGYNKTSLDVWKKKIDNNDAQVQRNIVVMNTSDNIMFATLNIDTFSLSV